MGTRVDSGFTIIETTLFLAVTGLLILLIVAGTGSGINAQRYRDSVENFKSLLQQQYASLSSVQNSRGDELSCGPSAVAESVDGASQTRGQSECVLVGKYMRIDRTDIRIYNVLAYQIGSSQTDDIDSMRLDYVMNASELGAERRQVEWGSQIAWAQAGDIDQNANTTPRTMGILFIRSPASGQVYTFTTDTITPLDNITPQYFSETIAGEFDDGVGQADRYICIESGGLATTGAMGIYIAPYAAGPAGIEVRTNDTPASVERGSEC